MQHVNIYSADVQVARFVSLETLKSLLEFKKFQLPQVDVGEILREVKATGTCWCSRQREVSFCSLAAQQYSIQSAAAVAVTHSSWGMFRYFKTPSS